MFIDTNKIATVFGRENIDEYIRRDIRKGNLVRIKNKGDQVSELTSPINASYNEKAPVDNISQNKSNVNTNK